MREREIVLMKSPTHYARPIGAEWCNDVLCEHCRIGKRRAAADLPVQGEPHRD